MAVCRVEHKHIHLCIYESTCSVKHVLGHADSRTAKESALFISCRIRITLCLFDVFYGDKSLEYAVCVHKRELFDLVFHKDALSPCKVCAHRCSHQVILCHYVLDKDRVKVLDKSQVTVGEYAHQLVVLINDRHAGDLILAHKCVSLGNCFIGCKRERVNDNSVFRPFYLIHLVSLLSYGHVLVDYSYAAFTCDGNCHPGLGDRIHGRGHYRCVQDDILGEVSVNVHHVGSTIGLSWYEQHVVKGDAFLCKFFVFVCFKHNFTSRLPSYFKLRQNIILHDTPFQPKSQ